MKLNIPKLQIVRYEASEANIVPKKYKDYLTDMNYIYAKYSQDVFCGRDKEINRIFDSLLKTKKNNVILLGNNGVGKSATVQATVYKIIKGECPEELQNHHFIYWDIEKILTLSASDADYVKKEVAGAFNFITSYSNIVVVIEKVHLVMMSRALLYQFSTMLKQDHVKVIGITTADDFYDFFQYENKIMTSVDIIPILEPKASKIYPMISKYIAILEKRHNVTITEDIVNYIISISGAFLTDLCHPGLTVDFIEKSMITAKKNKNKAVTKRDVNANLNFNYELFSKIPLKDKKITAYHEAGHFIVSKYSEHIKNYRTTAISIVPAENFLGITLFEFEPEKQTSCDADYYIDNIAVDLAGRVAELILQGKEDDKNAKVTSGAYSDLKNATQTARNIVTEFGMIDSCGGNMTFFANYDLVDLALLSDEKKKLIDESTKKLIDEAYKRAKSILTSKRELLSLIAKELLRHEVLDAIDLENLCNQVKNK